MKFNCGESLTMRLTKRYERLHNWHSWYAWYPVRIADDICVWLEPVERKNNGPACVDGWDEWEYRQL